MNAETKGFEVAPYLGPQKRDRQVSYRIAIYNGSHMVQSKSAGEKHYKDVRPWSTIEAAKQYINQKAGQQSNFNIVNLN